MASGAAGRAERRAWPDDIYCHRQLVNIAAGCRAALALTSVPL
jgi:hypothetical protein